MSNLTLEIFERARASVEKRNPVVVAFVVRTPQMEQRVRAISREVYGDLPPGSLVTPPMVAVYSREALKKYLESFDE